MWKYIILSFLGLISSIVLTALGIISYNILYICYIIFCVVSYNIMIFDKIQEILKEVDKSIINKTNIQNNIFDVIIYTVTTTFIITLLLIALDK